MPGIFLRFVKDAESMGKTEYPVHIKLDTGMHRLGFEKQELEALAAYLPDAKSVKIASVFSHFAASCP